MIRRPPRSKRPDTPFPDTTLYRSRPPPSPPWRPRARSHTPRPTAGRRSADSTSPAPPAGWRRVEYAHRRRHLGGPEPEAIRSEEHTSELQSLMRISYAVFCLKKKNKVIHINNHHNLIIHQNT